MIGAEISIWKIIVSILNLVAFGCFILGVTQPMFVLEISGQAETVFGNLNTERMLVERSIWQSVYKLIQNKSFLLGFLIGLFSVVFPLVKISLLFVSIFSTRIHLIYKKFGVYLGKWSMADVFVVSIFPTYLTLSQNEVANKSIISILGLDIDVNSSVTFDTRFSLGFYFYLAHVLIIMLVSTVWVYREDKLNVAKKVS